ncbi:hypothetical protein SAMN05444398_12214 [Roseovarius pacificus]|uniref:Response regulatory domain-containing protein n=1 Tax=Roseovarius pacificus TaxID=337701 RepID=A0A1M7JSZ2_9RHOB|nr:hypothetical protein [Roseovarius pacificus]GGO62237.1 hypothetical protein GCM10011315_40770 [Roseovarius pacificus]SHM56114.1 hypothetical protein SAMN05444398_12214 [Roseovarius pacificus]
MLLQDFQAESAVPVAKASPNEERRVLALLDWDHLPYELSHPSQEFRMWLVRGEDADRVLGLMRQCQVPLDVLIIDEDFFGFPEDAADICLWARRMYPDILIVGVESEMCEGDSVLLSLGLCDDTLPATPDVGAIVGKLVTLN